MEKMFKKHSLLSVIAIIFLSFSFLTACSSSSEDSSEAEARSESIAKEEANNSQAGNAPVNNGDMNTADANAQGTIVGNSRSMIYHVPGQRGYRMNSENAVYFNTEDEAQAAGYRRSLR